MRVRRSHAPGGRRELQARKELPALHDLEQHVEAVSVAVRVEEADDEGVVDAQQDVLLVEDVSLLLHLHDGRLLQHLERVHLARRAVVDEAHAAEGARAERLLQLQLTQGKTEARPHGGR